MTAAELDEALGQVEQAHMPMRGCEVVVMHKDDKEPAKVQEAYFDERRGQFVIEL